MRSNGIVFQYAAIVSLRDDRIKEYIPFVYRPAFPFEYSLTKELDIAFPFIFHFLQTKFLKVLAQHSLYRRAVYHRHPPSIVKVHT